MSTFFVFSASSLLNCFFYGEKIEPRKDVDLNLQLSENVRAEVVGKLFFSGQWVWQGIGGVLSELLITVRDPQRISQPFYLLSPVPSQNGGCYIVSENKIHFISSKSGKVVWSFNANTNSVYLQELEDILICYVYDISRPEIIALDANRGYLLWRTKDVLKDAKFKCANNRIYLFNKREIVVYDILNGRIFWKRRYQEQFLSPYTEIIDVFPERNALFVRQFDTGRGYYEYVCVNVYDGANLWSCLGDAIDVGKKSTRFYKKREDEVWLRSNTDGKLLNVFKLDSFNKDFLEMQEENLIYSSTQRYFVEKGVVIGANNAHSSQDLVLTKEEIICYDQHKDYIKWFFEYKNKGEKVLVYSSDRLIFVLKNLKEISLDKVSFFDIDFYSKTTGKFLWRMNVPSGIYNISAMSEYVYILGNDGILYIIRWGEY